MCTNLTKCLRTYMWMRLSVIKETSLVCCGRLISLGDMGVGFHYSIPCLSPFLPKSIHLHGNKDIHLHGFQELCYSVEARSLRLREESRIKVFENRILRQLFGPKRDENGEWRRLHNEELPSLYGSPYIVRMINLED